MGCDIHMHVEYRNPGQASWYCGDLFYTAPISQVYNREQELELRCVPIHYYRDYHLFATLADVRNDGTVKCIDGPRGLPADISGMVMSKYREWEDDAHSCSYLTLRELIDFVTANGDDEGDLTELIDKLKTRADELWLIYKYYWDSNYYPYRAEAYERSNNIRIVFWFDN